MDLSEQHNLSIDPVTMRMREAYAILAAIPANKFVPFLDHYFTEATGKVCVPADWAEAHQCETLACGAGWLALHPAFKHREYTGDRFYGPHWTEAQFGSRGLHLLLFGARDHSPFDAEADILNDKQLLLYRFRRAWGEDKYNAMQGALLDSPC